MSAVRSDMPYIGIHTVHLSGRKDSRGKVMTSGQACRHANCPYTGYSGADHKRSWRGSRRPVCAPASAGAPRAAAGPHCSSQPRDSRRLSLHWTVTIVEFSNDCLALHSLMCSFSSTDVKFVANCRRGNRFLSRNTSRPIPNTALMILTMPFADAALREAF